ncbi:MAG: Holliday junction resolvase-like protein [Chloroflexota bacterium]
MNISQLLILFLVIVASLFIGYYLAKVGFELKLRQWRETKEKEWQEEREKTRKEAITQSRQVLGGKFTEQMAAYLPDFKYDPTEARFIGSPIDMIIFPGLAQGNPREIVIMEIKSGKTARLTPEEAKIRELIEGGMVRWELLQRPGAG